MYTNDPEGVGKSLHFSSNIDYQDIKKITLSDEENLKRNPLKHIKRGSKNRTLHTICYKTLRHVWESYLKQPSVMARKSEVAPILLNAIFKELSWVLEFPVEKELDQKFIDQINSRLIMAIDEKMVNFQ
jgi:hypothetical protein